MSAVPACLYCGARKALWTAIDEPENEGALLFGDQTAAVVLCEPCLEASEREGPWNEVRRVDGRRPAA